MPVAPGETPYESATDEISSLLAALVPLSEPTIAFIRSQGEDTDYGESGHRSFWWEYITFRVLSASTVTLRRVEHECFLRVRFNRQGATVGTMPNLVQRDAVRIVHLINSCELWPAATARGVVNTMRAEMESQTEEGDDVIINFRCKVYTREVLA